MELSNEELAVQAKGGDPDVLLSLWERVRRLAAGVAIGYLALAARNGACGLEDMIQCGYLGMVEAVARFHEGGCSFASLFVLCHRTECWAVLGLRGRVRKEHYERVSLDAPVLSSDGDESSALVDLLPDNSLIPVDETLDRDDLRTCMQRLVKRLSPRQRQIIERHYWGGQTFTAQAEALGTGLTLVTNVHAHALQRLRYLWFGNPGAMLLYNPYTYCRQGKQAWMNTMTSTVELAAFWNIDAERYRDRYLKMQEADSAGIAQAVATKNKREGM